MALIAMVSGLSSAHAQPSEQVLTKRLNAIRFADQFPGSAQKYCQGNLATTCTSDAQCGMGTGPCIQDAGLKIAAALADLPAEGGTVDARGLTGQWAIRAPLNVGSAFTKPVVLLLGPAVLTTNSVITVQANSAIVGSPVAAQVGWGSPNVYTRIQAQNGAALPVVVRLGSGVDQSGEFAVLQDVVVDGNKAGGGTNTSTFSSCILVDKSARTEFFRVTAQNCGSNGIRVVSSVSASACCAKMVKVMAVANGRTGLFIERTNDVFVSQSEFEDNGYVGIELNGGSSALRLTNSDSSGNLMGLYGYGGASYNHVLATQWTNEEHDIAFDANSNFNLIANNIFIPSGFRTLSNVYSAIRVLDSKSNNITGNVIDTGTPPAAILWAGIHVLSTGSGGPNLVSSNVIGGTAGGGAGITVAPNNMKDGNLVFGAPQP